MWISAMVLLKLWENVRERKEKWCDRGERERERERESEWVSDFGNGTIVEIHISSHFPK